MKVKVCGLTQPNNLQQALDVGVDYVGFIFYDQSKRFAADPGLKKWIKDNEDRFENTAKVGVFVNAEVDYVLNTVHDYALDYVQLHGDESAGYCQELKLLWSVNTLRGADIIKAFRITPAFDFDRTREYANSASLFIFDTGGQGEHGGTGLKWDWDRLSEYQGPTSFLLSGGIGPRDAVALEKLHHPQFMGVDVNSRFESAPGVKDIALLRGFVDRIDE